ncbi:unnamed protein product [Symbiodinium sp. KB8]|nr:unnamed protein product [Symbiodinium sp. KB8]
MEEQPHLKQRDNIRELNELKRKNEQLERVLLERERRSNFAQTLLAQRGAQPAEEMSGIDLQRAWWLEQRAELLKELRPFGHLPRWKPTSFAAPRPRREMPREPEREPPREISREVSREMSREPSKEMFKEPPKEMPKEPLRPPASDSQEESEAVSCPGSSYHSLSE